jgi:hypothetical protein
MPQPFECSSCVSRARSPRRRHPSAHRPHVRGAAARSGGQPSARSHPQSPQGRPVSETRARRGWPGRDVARSEHGGILPSRWAAACCRSSPGHCHRDRRHAVDPSSQRAIRAPPPSYACEPAEVPTVVTFRDESSVDTGKQAGSRSPFAAPSASQERATVGVVLLRARWQGVVSCKASGRRDGRDLLISGRILDQRASVRQGSRLTE